METKKNKWARPLAVVTALLIVVSILNWGVITGWGNVKITKVRIAGDDGITYTALMYTPADATDDNPAPAALFLHGGSGNARNHESWAVEYARRGFVVLSVDNLGAGDGSYISEYGDMVIPTVFMEYLISLNNVQTDNIVVSGHSQGGQQAYALAIAYPENVSVMISANAANSMDDSGVKAHMLYLNGTADKVNEVSATRVNVADIFTRNGIEVDTIEVGKLYGSFDTQAAKFVEIEGQIHEGAFITKDHIAAQLDFLQQAIDVPDEIDADNQVWMYKDVMGLLGMLVFASFLVILALFLVEAVPFFSAIGNPMPRNIGLRGKGLALSVGCAILFPLASLYTGAFGLVNLFGAGSANLAPVFNLRYTDIAFATVISLNIFGLLMLFLFWFTEGKKQHGTIRELGLVGEGTTKIDLRLIGKSLLLALIVVAVGWAYLELQGDVLGTDFYCLFFGYKPIPMQKVLNYIPYCIGWIICFSIAAIGMNVERRLPSAGNDKLDTVIAMAVNIVLAAGTITVMVFVENAIQVSIGSSGRALANWGTNITRIWGMPVGMIIGAGGNTYLYRKTGNIWLGAMLMGIVCALSACLYGQVRF